MPATRADSIDLWFGAEGTLGINSEVTVCLMRRRGSRVSYLQFLDLFGEAFRFDERGRSSGGAPAERRRAPAG